MTYRKDLNGLRAYAVLAVVIYHFWPNLLPGGFIGVDVFFVISGYLMTGIVLKGINSNTFKLTTFYIARIDRIIPALLVMVFFVSFMGYFFLPYNEQRELSTDAVGSLFFVSNILYSLDSGYFSTHSLDKWLLHTWSLSVEWQFYLVFPLALLLLNKFQRNATNKIVWISAIVIIFLYSLYLSKNFPLEAFFHIQSRAWELLAGGLVYIIPFRSANNYKKLTEFAGLFLIIMSALFFNKWKLWPGYLALAPVLGTCLIILADVNKSFFTHNTILQYIGKRSYSLYLWHWPVVVVINYWSNTDVALQLVAFLCTFLIAALSFTYVEKRVVRSFYYANYKGILYLGVVCVVIAYFSSIYFKANKNDDRVLFNKIISQQIMPSVDNGYCFKDFNNGITNIDVELTKPCSIGDEAGLAKVLLFGDSYAGQYEPMLDEFAKINNFKIDAITTNWCHPSFEKSFFPNREQHPSYEQCMLNRKYLEEQNDSYEVVILAGAWANISRMGYYGEIESIVELLANKGKTVYLLPSAVGYDMDIVKKFQVLLFNELPFDTDRFSKTADNSNLEIHKALLSLSSKHGNVNFISREHLYESHDQFIIDNINVPYSLDGSHISLIGSKNLTSQFIKSKHAKQLLEVIN
jgi:peptidoglycan/LPS O-acetylase OafA/YrhL